MSLDAGIHEDDADDDATTVTVMGSGGLRSQPIGKRAMMVSRWSIGARCMMVGKLRAIWASCNWPLCGSWFECTMMVVRPDDSVCVSGLARFAPGAAAAGAYRSEPTKQLVISSGDGEDEKLILTCLTEEQLSKSPWGCWVVVSLAFTVACLGYLVYSCQS